MQEIMKEALQETGLEGLRGRPVPEDGAGDRQLPGEAPVVRKLQESQAPGEEWPRVADTVPGHLEVRVSRVRVRVDPYNNSPNLKFRPFLDPNRGVNNSLL